MKHSNRSSMPRLRLTLATLFLSLPASQASADLVTDWNRTAVNLVVSAKKSPGFGQFALAMTNTAVYAAVNAITKEHAPVLKNVPSPANASLEAAVAAATHATLSKLLPDQKSDVDSKYQSAIAKIDDEAAREAGIAVGQAASAATFAHRKRLKKSPKIVYRPATTPGVYVPTPPMAGVNGKGLIVAAQSPTWVLDNPAALASPPPLALDSDVWVRDYNEVKALGSKDSTQRTKEQTQIALFWEDTQPHMSYTMLRSAADQPGRNLTRNARLLAAAGQAMNDAITAVFEAKYRHQFWRPMTAIRNGDKDPSDKTERDPGWAPLIKTPMHPEYPCAHCIVAAAAAGAVIADLAGDKPSNVKTESLKLPGVTRTYANADDYAKEAIEARIYDGVHYRTSGEVGYKMGMKIGQMAISKYQTK